LHVSALAGMFHSYYIDKYVASDHSNAIALSLTT
jgi:hypothetical protein